jgi:hypothetical protein
MPKKPSITSDLIKEDGNKPKNPPHVRKYSNTEGTRLNYKENPYNYHKLFRDFNQVKRAYYEDRNRFVIIYEEMKNATDAILQKAVEEGDLAAISEIARMRTDIASNTYKALDPLTKALIEVRKMAELVEKQIEKSSMKNISTDKDEVSFDDITKLLGN